MKYHKNPRFSPSEASIFHAPEILFWRPSRAQAPTGKFLRYCSGVRGGGGGCSTGALSSPSRTLPLIV